MKQRKPLSFVFFCIYLGIIIAVMVPASLMRSSETPGWLGGTMLILFLLGILLIPVTLIMALIYKTDVPQNKVRNRIALWGSVAIILGFVTVILYSALFSHGGGVAMPG